MVVLITYKLFQILRCTVFQDVRYNCFSTHLNIPKKRKKFCMISFYLLGDKSFLRNKILSSGFSVDKTKDILSSNTAYRTYSSFKYIVYTFDRLRIEIPLLFWAFGETKEMDFLVYGMCSYACFSYMSDEQRPCLMTAELPLPYHKGPPSKTLSFPRF